MLLGIIPMLIFFTKGVYFSDDLFTWLLSAYALIGIINLVQGVRNIMSLQRSDEKLPRGEVYGVVLKEQFFEVTTAVSGDGGYIEHVVSTDSVFLEQ